MDDNRFTNNTLSAVDYVIFALVLAVSAGIGIFFGCRGQKTTADFLMGGRSMSVFPVTLSLLASFLSAITLLGTPSEIYTYDIMYFWIVPGYMLMIPLAAHVYAPIFYNLKLTSVFEYMELRFGVFMRLACVVAYIIQTVLYTSIVLYAPSLALEAVTGFNVWAAVFSVGVVCTFYTTIGGMKAVMWTDAFQIIIMFIGLLAVLIQGSIDFGFGKIWQDMIDGDRVRWWNFDPSPTTRHTQWSLIIGGLFTWLPIFGVNQAQVQRVMSVPTLKKAQLALWANFPGLAALLIICGCCGMVCYSSYKECDPLTQGRISAMDQLLPRYVMDYLSYINGLPGLFTASLFSGALSTISSSLNSLAAVVLEDIIKPHICVNITEQRATLMSKLLALGFGALCIALTFVAAQLGGVLQAALGIFGMIGGPQLGVFTLGILYPFANNKGAIAGFFTSLIFTLWLGIGAQVYKPPTEKAPVSIANCTSFISNITTTMATATVTAMDDVTTTAPGPKAGYLTFYATSYMWYGTLAVGVACGVGVVVSLITGPTKPENVDPRLVYPILSKMMPCLPAKVKRCLSCYVDYDKAEATEDSAVKIANGVHPGSGQGQKLEEGSLNPAFEGGVEMKPPPNPAFKGGVEMKPPPNPTFEGGEITPPPPYNAFDNPTFSTVDLDDYIQPVSQNTRL